ncbi:MAG: LysR family transcriptional regulator [Rhodocyclaceae bacterium]
MLDLEHMAIFAQVADSGSFTAAARLLGLPKSTVSQRIAQLEASLGVRLIVRTTRRLSLTHAGQIYHAHCRKVVEAAEAANASMSQLREAPTGTLRITVPEASGVRLFPALLAVFRDRHPGVQLDCVVTDAHLDLVAERIDVAFRTGVLADSSFVSRRLATIRRVLVASPSYLDVHGEPASAADLLRHAGLIHHPLPRWPLRVDEQVVSVEPTPTYVSNSLLQLGELAVAGAGVALLPYFMCRQQVAVGALRVLLPSAPPTTNDYWMISAGRAHQPAAVTAFMRFIDEYGLSAMLSGEASLQA